MKNKLKKEMNPEITESEDEVAGIVRKIEKYELEQKYYSPINIIEAKITTRLLIDVDNNIRSIDFFGYVGSEIVGEKIKYSDKKFIKLTLLDEERKNITTWRRLKREENIMQEIIPEDKNLPRYLSRRSFLYYA